MNVIIDGVKYVPQVKIELMPMSFGEFISALRAEVKYSLDEACKKAGVSRSYLWELENDNSEPSLRTAKGICRAYGVPIETLASYLI